MHTGLYFSAACGQVLPCTTHRVWGHTESRSHVVHMPAYHMQESHATPRSIIGLSFPHCLCVFLAGVVHSIFLHLIASAPPLMQVADMAAEAQGLGLPQVERIVSSGTHRKEWKHRKERNASELVGRIVSNGTHRKERNAS